MATCEECEKEDHVNCANAWTWDDICECKLCERVWHCEPENILIANHLASDDIC